MLGQYSLGGPANKRALLASEGLDPDGLEGLARAGIRYIGSDTTRIYCLPTCHNAKRISDKHRVPFRSAADGARAGYRACRECRPGGSRLTLERLEQGGRIQRQPDLPALYAPRLDQPTEPSLSQLERPA